MLHPPDDGLPSPDDVLKYGVSALGGLAAAGGLLATESLWAKQLSDEEIWRRNVELKRRIERLKELICAVENTESGDAVDEEQVGQIKFDMVIQRCREVEQLAPERENFAVLEDGFHWCAKLLNKELRIAIKKTREGKDLEYSDGSKLDKLLRQPETLERVSCRADCKLPRELYATIQAQAREGEAVRRVQKRAYLWKAFMLLLRARETWPWVVANNLVAVASGVLSTVALDYHAELLETFRHPQFTRHRFSRIATAWAVVELCSHLLSVVGSQLSVRGEKVASRILQVQLFRAISKQELMWWERKTESDVAGFEGLVRHRMPFEVSRVLNIPRDFVRRIASISAAAWRMRTRSGRLLYMMLAIQWSSVVARKFVRWLRERAQQMAYRGVVMPSQDDHTFRFALRPEYVSLYQSFSRSLRETRLFEQYILNHQRFEQRMMTVGQILDPVDKVVRQASTIAQISAVGGLVQTGLATDGQARALMHHASEITREVESAYWDWTGSHEKCAELAKAHDMITLCPTINPDVGTFPKEAARGSIVFEDVHFEYPNRKGSILKGVSFEVRPGEVAALVGKTGCGKTTIFRVLQRFYDVSDGRVQLDGQDIRDYSPEWLRAQIATVSQEPDLIPLTIRDNIAIGCPHDPSVDEIREACQAANIWDVLNDKDKFPEGLQTKMRKVKNISGGEKQRISIARAILADPPLLLLDEATSALDTETETMVQEALEKLMKGRTTMVIAHRLSTICKADAILGMKDGKIVEVGTHQELLSKDDSDESCVYGRLWREQVGSTGASSSRAAERGFEDAPPLQQSSLQGAFGALKVKISEASRTRDVQKAKVGLLEVLQELQRQADVLASEQQQQQLSVEQPAPRGASSDAADAQPTVDEQCSTASRANSTNAEAVPAGASAAEEVLADSSSTGGAVVGS